MTTPMLLALLLAAPLAAEPAAGPTAGLPAREPDCVPVELQTSDKQTIKGDFWGPKREGERAPCALLVHDAGADRRQLAPIAERLQKLGFAVLTLDLRGHGESVSKDLDWNDLDEPEREQAWALATRDLEAGAAWLRRQRGVHTTNLNLVGVRAGCSLVVRHALRDENVRSLGLVGPQPKELGFDLEGDIQELAGLPTYLVAPKAQRETCDQIVTVAHTAAGGRAFIELKISKSKLDALLEDRKITLDLSKWVQDKAFPSRGN